MEFSSIAIQSAGKAADFFWWTAVKGCMTHDTYWNGWSDTTRTAPLLSQDRQEAFLSILRKRGVAATLRREKGHDIDAACGQLRLQTKRELETASS